MKAIVKALLLNIMVLTAFVAVPAMAQTTFNVPSSGKSSYCDGYTGGLDLMSDKTASDTIKFFTCFLQRTIIPLLFSVALFFFIYGVFDFIRSSSSGEVSEQKRQFMLWGVIALAVMIGVWGLVSIFTNTFGIGLIIPQLPVNPQ